MVVCVLVDAELLLVFLLGLDEQWSVEAQTPLAIGTSVDDLAHDHDLGLGSSLTLRPRLDALM